MACDTAGRRETVEQVALLFAAASAYTGKRHAKGLGEARPDPSIRILHELQKNGRITNVELAELVHLSSSPCWSEKKLQKGGYITGYSAQIDIAKLGQALTVFHPGDAEEPPEDRLRPLPAGGGEVDEIIECHLISGGYTSLH